MKQSYVYILASRSEKLYIGVTSNLIKRVYQHKEKVFHGHTTKYNINRLVYYEVHNNISQAILREKQMKKWIRQYKINIITDLNPSWKDLYGDII